MNFYFGLNVSLPNDTDAFAFSWTLTVCHSSIFSSVPLIVSLCHTCSFHSPFFIRLAVSPSVSDDLRGAAKVSRTKGTSPLEELYDFLMGQQSLQPAAITAN